MRSIICVVIAVAMCGGWVATGWSAETTDNPARATKAVPFVNSLGMQFVPAPGANALFSVYDTRVQDFAVFQKETGIGPPKPDFEQSPVHPVVMVTWQDAFSFCEWLSKKEHRTYRLPTDAEWSAAVGLAGELGKDPQEKSVNGPPEKHPWGEAWPPPAGAGNYAEILHVDSFPKTSPVGSFAPNADGLCDLGGNVWQWCADWYDGNRRDRTLRGGSWFNSEHALLRSCGRSKAGPMQRLGYVGFRCVLEAPGFYAEAARAMVYIERENGSGVGFRARMDGKIYLVTNSRLIASGKPLKFTNAAGESVTPGPFQIAEKVDVVRAEVPEAGPSLEFVPAIDGRLGLGQAVTILDNTVATDAFRKGERDAHLGHAIPLLGGATVNEVGATITDLEPDRLHLNLFSFYASGAPVFWGSTHLVAGVSSYLMTPRQYVNRPSPENRAWGMAAIAPADRPRVAYRLDAIQHWVTPAAPDSIAAQGAVLNRIEAETSVLMTIFQAGADRMIALGADRDIDVEDVRRDDNLAALIKGLNEFRERHQQPSNEAPVRNKWQVAFLDFLRPYLDRDTHDLQAAQFSGYCALRLEQELERRKRVAEWFNTRVELAAQEAVAADVEAKAVAAAKAARETAAKAERESAPKATPMPPDVAVPNVQDLRLVLSDLVDAKAPPGRQHYVSYPAENKPPVLKNVFWIIKDPTGNYRIVPMSSNAVRVDTPMNGAYRVYVEYGKPRGKGKKGAVDKVVISNAVEFTVTAIPEAPGGAAGQPTSNQ